MPRQSARGSCRPREHAGAGGTARLRVRRHDRGEIARRRRRQRFERVGDDARDTGKRQPPADPPPPTPGGRPPPGAAGSAPSVSAMTRAILVTGTPPPRKASTATSFAALSTALAVPPRSSAL